MSGDIYEQVREALRIADSIEAMKLATQEIDKKLGDAYPNGLAAEIEDIKRRLSILERHWQWQEECGFFIHPWSERPSKGTVGLGGECD